MKILHYIFGIPPVRGGGAVRYMTDLMEEESRRGLDVILLIPGVIPKNTNKKSRIISAGYYVGCKKYEIYNPLPISMSNGIKDIDWFTQKADIIIYENFLKRESPDLIHMHNFMGIHKEFLEAANELNISIVFTTHDYFGLCPTVNKMLGNEICVDKDWRYCQLCSQNAYSKKRLITDQARWYRLYRNTSWLVDFIHRRVLKLGLKQLQSPEPAHIGIDQLGKQCDDYSELREYYRQMLSLVTYYHFNSSQTRHVFEENLGQLSGQIITVSHKDIVDNRHKKAFKKTLKIGYLGNKSVNKGFYQLLDVLQQMRVEGLDDFELHTYFGQEVSSQEYVANHPYFKRNQLKEVMDSLDLVVVPSLWQETFGLVVLEAMSCGVPVIVSKNVGARDIIENNPGCGCVYSGEAIELKKLLIEIYNYRWILEKCNKNILDMAWDYSYHSHVDQMIEMYHRVIKG